MDSAHARSLAMVFLVAALQISCGGEEEAQPTARPVRYQDVVPAHGVVVRSFAGVTHAALETKLGFQVAGKVSRVLAKVGDKVGTGQVVAELDDGDYRLQLQQAAAQEKSARAQARNAEASYGRVQALWASGSASLTELEGARAMMESADAQVDAVVTQFRLAQSQLNYTRLMAPVAGQVAAMLVEAGEIVGPGQPVSMLASGDHLEVKLSLPEVLISRVHQGDSVSVSIGALGGGEISAVVTEVGVMSMGLATTYPVTVRLLDSDSRWRAGMAAEVVFRVIAAVDEADQLIVPSWSVGEDSGGRFVFVLDAAVDGLAVARRRQVEVGGLRDEGMMILNGLRLGERVVSAGVSRIQDGQQVKLLPPQ